MRRSSGGGFLGLDTPSLRCSDNCRLLRRQRLESELAAAAAECDQDPTCQLPHQGSHSPSNVLETAGGLERRVLAQAGGALTAGDGREDCKRGRRLPDAAFVCHRVVEHLERPLHCARCQLPAPCSGR